jgi:tRNA A37 methylthiotransferase MiaB
MNMLDSELVVAALRKDGYELTDNPKEADTILFNTCSVREHAEHKIYSALGRLKFSKRNATTEGDWRHGLHGSEGSGPDLSESSAC